MITEPVLAEAVEKGLVTSGQAEALRSLARERAPLPSRVPDPVDEEQLRFVSGFADIFVAIGIVLFLGSAAYLLDGRAPRDLAAGIVAVLAWTLSEFFTRRKRMALPSILLLCIFVGAGFAALLAALGGSAGAALPRLGWAGSLLGIGGFGRGDPLAGAAAALATAGLAAAHYWRFRVPITIAAGIAALVLALFLLLLAVAPNVVADFFGTIVFATGLAVFWLAMRFDAADPERLTRRTDIAFWLHLVAAPLIVHSAFRVIGVDSGPLTSPLAGAVLVVFLLLGAIAVIVDRRAMLVSGLAYAGIAFGTLVARTGLGGLTAPVTILVLGAFVLLLSAGWAPLRRAVLARLPETVRATLPRPHGA